MNHDPVVCFVFAAAYVARNGGKGVKGDPLPPNFCSMCQDYLADHIEEFAAQVRLEAYALAMEKLDLPADACPPHVWSDSGKDSDDPFRKICRSCGVDEDELFASNIELPPISMTYGITKKS